MPIPPDVVPASPASSPASDIPAIGVPVHAAVPPDVLPERSTRGPLGLFYHRDVVWKSATPEEASQTGKANFLRITPDGTIWLDVIKRGIRFMTGVSVDSRRVAPEDIKACIAQQSDWEKDMRLEGFLPEGMHEIPTEGEVVLTQTGGHGATYVFNRTMILKHPDGGEKGLQLRWIGKHTNPAEGKTNYSVNDELRLEKLG